MLATIYNPLVWAITVGRVRSLRRATLAAAAIRPGDDVLDVGCGTGELTVAAQRATGDAARVVAVDTSAAMLDRARRRAARAGARVEFAQEPAERLPFPDASFDVVTHSLLLHHLPPPTLHRAIGEARRVLRDGGRIVIVDFARSTGRASHVRAHLMLHGGFAAVAPRFGDLLSAAGFADVHPWPSPVPALAIVRATR